MVLSKGSEPRKLSRDKNQKPRRDYAEDAMHSDTLSSAKYRRIKNKYIACSFYLFFFRGGKKGQLVYLFYSNIVCFKIYSGLSFGT